MTDSRDDKDQTDASAVFFRHSNEAIQRKAAFIDQASDMLTVANALTLQWLEMNRKFADRASRRLEVASESIAETEQPDGTPMSFHERSEKFQNVNIENAKDYMDQVQRLALASQVLMERVAKRHSSTMGFNPAAEADKKG